MAEEQAFEVEAALIDAYPEVTNQVGGHASDERGLMHARQVIERYEAPEAVFNHTAIIISVNRTVAERESVYAAVRYAWKVDPKKAQAAQLVIAVEQGLIIGVFSPTAGCRRHRRISPGRPNPDRGVGVSSVKRRRRPSPTSIYAIVCRTACASAAQRIRFGTSNKASGDFEQHVTRENPKVFVARAGKHGEDEEYALEQGVAIIGFSDFPSLEGAKDYNAVLRLVTTAQPDLKPRVAGAFAGQLWNFALGMEVGDIVVLPRKLTSQVALGKITGRSAFTGRLATPSDILDLSNGFARTYLERHLVKDLLYSFGAFLTVFNVSRNDADRRVAAVLDGKADPGFVGETVRPKEAPPLPANRQPETATDLAQAAHDQIVAHIQSKFAENIHCAAGRRGVACRRMGDKVVSAGP